VSPASNLAIRSFGTATGSFAEFACASPRLWLSSRKTSPGNKPHRPHAAITALQGLRDKAGILPGQQVLINGASGRRWNIRRADRKSLKAASPESAAPGTSSLSAPLAADEVIDYTRQDFPPRRARYGCVFRSCGNHPLSASLRVLRPKAFYIGCGGRPQQAFDGAPRLHAHSFLLRPFVSQKMPGLIAKVNTGISTFSRRPHALRPNSSPVLDALHLRSQPRAIPLHRRRATPAAKSPSPSRRNKVATSLFSWQGRNDRTPPSTS